MTLTVWFDHQEESFSYKEVHLQKVCLPVKPIALLLKTNYDTLSMYSYVLVNCY